MFVVVAGQDFTCCRLYPSILFLKHMALHTHTHETSGRSHKNFPVRPMKDSDLGSHITCLHIYHVYKSSTTADGTYLKNLCQSIQKQALRIRKRKKRMAIAKCFALHANAINIC